MQTFFHGWRRKSGVVALGLALVAMAGWIRSYVAIDWGHVSTGAVNLGFQSFSGYLYLYANRGPGFLYPIRWASQPMDSVGTRLVENAHNWTFPLIPYWSLTVPLTLLSAYLLLWRPRKRG